VELNSHIYRAREQKKKDEKARKKAEKEQKKQQQIAAEKQKKERVSSYPLSVTCVYIISKLTALNLTQHLMIENCR